MPWTAGVSGFARKVFGTEAFNAAIDEMTADLMTWGYTRRGNIVGLRCALAETMLTSRSLRLSDIKADTLERLYSEADAKITRLGLTILSYVLDRRGLLQKPLGRDGRTERKESISHLRVLDGVPPVWREQWFATTTLRSSTHVSMIYRLLSAGRWLASTGYGLEPADWNREIAAAYVAAIDRSTIGQWSTGAATPASRVGQPLKPASKASALTAMRLFFRDCQEWGWIPVSFNPFQALDNAFEFSDGVLTKVGSFQKLFTQDEFRDYLRTVLGRRPHMASLGIAYVFRDDQAEADYLAQVSLYRPANFRETVRAEFSKDRTAQKYMALARVLGRTPLETEFKASPRLIERYGSLSRVERIAKSLLDSDTLASAQEERRVNILMFLAMLRLQALTPPPIRSLSNEVRPT